LRGIAHYKVGQQGSDLMISHDDNLKDGKHTSASQIGMTVVIAPSPKPATSLPTMNCGTPYEHVWTVAPSATMTAPAMLIGFRPNRSPNVNVAAAPNMAPTS
jgi:hypothetical protein